MIKNRFWFLVLGFVGAVAAAPGKPMCEVRIKVEGRLVGADSLWLGLQDRKNLNGPDADLWSTVFRGGSVDTTISLPAGRDYSLGGTFSTRGAVRGLLVSISTPLNTEYYAPELDFDAKAIRRSSMLGLVSWFSLTSVCEVD